MSILDLDRYKTGEYGLSRTVRYDPDRAYDRWLSRLARQILPGPRPHHPDTARDVPPPPIP